MEMFTGELGAPSIEADRRTPALISGEESVSSPLCDGWGERDGREGFLFANLS